MVKPPVTETAPGLQYRPLYVACPELISANHDGVEDCKLKLMLLCLLRKHALRPLKSAPNLRGREF